MPQQLPTANCGTLNIMTVIMHTLVTTSSRLKKRMTDCAEGQCMA